MTELEYWVWLSLVLGPQTKIKEVLEHFSSIEEIFNSDTLTRAECKAITPSRLARFEFITYSTVRGIIDCCETNGWDIITYGDDRYPQLLREIDTPPIVLYVSGTMPDFNNRLVLSLVGTRKASPYSKKATQMLSYQLAECGAIIVSGGALGIDSSAHSGALKAGGTTVAVLGCGLASNYLKTNQELRDKIIENGGALISEFPPYATADKKSFPIRNRIISGLSRGVIVTESADKGGSMITADLAKKQGRDVFALPGSIFDKNFCGNNNLIDRGAYVVTGAESVIRHYVDEYYNLNLSKLDMAKTDALNIDRQFSFESIVADRQAENDRQEKVILLSDSERAVYNALGDDFMNIEVLCQSVDLPPNMVLAMLSMLDAKGLVENQGSTLYRRK